MSTRNICHKQLLEYVEQLERALADYARDEDKHDNGVGEPYGFGISDETRIVARRALRNVETREIKKEEA